MRSGLAASPVMPPRTSPGDTTASPGSRPASSASTARASRTDLVSTPVCEIPYSDSPAGAPLMVPRLTLSATSPQCAAGLRSEPPPSVPWASAVMPAATAAAEPPEDPPADRLTSQGLRVSP